MVKRGGVNTAKSLPKNNKKFATAKTEANTENEIEYENETNVDFEINKYVRDEILEKSILTFFGFNEIRNQDKQSLIFQFCTSLHSGNLLELFKIQFSFYCQLKILTGFKHNFNNFLGNQSECFTDGAWNAENWEQKLIEEKQKGFGKKDNRGTDAVIEAFSQNTLRA